MNSKIYVGNLSHSITESDLRNLFSRAGYVASVALIKDQKSGNSKGFAFVEMMNQAETGKAISMFNGYNMGKRELRVSLSRPREEQSELRGRPRGHSPRPTRRGGKKHY